MRDAHKKTMYIVASCLLFAAAMAVGFTSYQLGAPGLLWPVGTLLVGAVFFGVRSRSV